MDGSTKKNTDFNGWLKARGLAGVQLLVDDAPVYIAAPKTVTLTPEILHQMDRAKRLQNAVNDVLTECPEYHSAYLRELDSVYKYISWLLAGLLYGEHDR